MSEPRVKSFDCVQSMRDARNRISTEIAEMDYAELVRWVRDHRYEDPVLQRLAEKAGRGADAADRHSARG